MDGVQADFDAIVTYSGGISITVSTTEINKVFSEQEVQQHLNDRPKDVLIGGLTLTATATSEDIYTVTSYAAAAYVDDIDHFRGLSDSGGKQCKFTIFGNKNASGESTATEMINDSVIISNATNPGVLTRTLGINIYVLRGQFEDLSNTTCFLPLQFKVETS